jgi:hypothetical protein
MLAPSRDPLWDVAARERESEQRLVARLKFVDAGIDTARRSEAIRNSIGYADLVKSIEALRDLEVRSLIADDRHTNEGLREHRGRVRGIEDVLRILTKESPVQMLEAEKAQLEAALVEERRRRPKRGSS